MKGIIIFVFAIGLFCFNSTAKAQNMTDLYDYLIEDYYNELIDKGYFLEQDTIYFTCGFCDCPNSCFDYNIELKNDIKIQFGMPPLDKDHPHGSVHKISTPELDGEFVSISIGSYGVKYQENDNTIIYGGTTIYLFKYNKKKLKYEFKEKKEYGL
jgi:hypothetical protein